jgi:hypothetical protein
MGKKKIGALIIFIFLGIILIILWQIKTKSTSQKVMVKPSSNLTAGKISITSATQYAVTNMPMEFLVTADSAGKNIIGFDIDLAYDRHYLKFIQAQNLLSDQFDYFISEKNEQLLISGIKKINNQKKSVFKETPLFKLRFQTIKNGKTKLNIIRQDKQTNESNLITENNEDILAKATAPIIYINEMINLKKNQTIFFNKKLKVTLTEVSKASQDCRDCLTYAKFLVEEGNEKKELYFKIGGFAGYLTDKLQFKNYLFFLKEVEKDSVNFIIYEI